MKKLAVLLVAVFVLLAGIATALAASPVIQVHTTTVGVGEYSEDVFTDMNDKKLIGETYMKPLTVNYINTSKIIVASNESVGVQGYSIFQTAKTKFCVKNYDIGAGVGFAASNTTQSEFVVLTEQTRTAIQLQSLANGEIKAWAIAKDPANHTELFRTVENVRGLNIQMNFTAQIEVPDFVAGEMEEDWLNCP